MNDIRRIRFIEKANDGNQFNDYCDLTFLIQEKQNGWKTRVIDNHTDDEVTLNDIKPIAFEFYISMIENLSKEKIKKMLLKTA